MGEPRSFKPVKLIIGVLSTRADLHRRLFVDLESMYGPIEQATDPIPFDFTDYYDHEMGGRPERFFLLFRELVDPSLLVSCKLQTNRLEIQYAVEGKRVLNLDPGTLSAENLILATTKNRSHRIPLGAGIYGEVTLLYADHRFQDFAWTYADFRSPRFKNLFMAWRSAYLDQVGRTERI